MFVVLAYFAVLPSDLLVLFGIRYTVFALIEHALVTSAVVDNTIYLNESIVRLFGIFLVTEEKFISRNDKGTLTP